MKLPSGWVVHRYRSVASTMDAAARLAAAGAPDRTAVVSAEQTAGRGRGGRSWRAPTGSGLFCTLLLRPPIDPPRLSTLPLLAGVAVAEAIEQLVAGSPHPNPSPIEDGRGAFRPPSPVSDGPGALWAAGQGGEVPALTVRLKWPNDVWIGRDPAPAKVAGILVTSRLAGERVDYALVGIGVNVSASPADLPSGATSLLAVGVATTVEELFARVLARSEEVYSAYLAAGGRPSLAAWRARAALRGETVTIEEGGQMRQGTFVDVDDEGALLLQDAAGTITRVVAGDLVRGPKVDSA